MAAYCTGLNPIKIGDPRSKVKVTMIENVSKNDEKNFLKFQMYTVLKLKPTISYCRHFNTKHDHIV